MPRGSKCADCKKEKHVNGCYCIELGKPSQSNYIECYMCHLLEYHVSRDVNGGKAEVARP